MRLFILCLVCAFIPNIVRGQEVAQRTPIIEFEGGNVVSKQVLADVSNACLVKRFQPDQPDAIDYCLGQVKLILMGKGYLRAEFGQPQQRTTERGVEIIVPVKEGPLYRLGKIRVKGSNLFSEEQLLNEFHSKAGDAASFAAVNTWLGQDVQRAYADIGYIRFDFDVELIFKPLSLEKNEGIVDLEIEISEGQRFSIRKIIFEGSDHTLEQVIRDALLIREGDFFSRRLYEASIRNLNQLELFETVDGNKDVTWRTSDKNDRNASQIDLIFHLKGKMPQ